MSRLDTRMSRLDTRMSTLDIHVSMLDIHVSTLNIRMLVSTMLLLQKAQISKLFFVGHLWNLLVLTFSKHPLHVQFDQVLAEIFEVKDK